LPVGKGSIIRATNASNGNTDSKDMAAKEQTVKESRVKEKLVKEMPGILTDIPLTQITEVPASWKKKAVSVPKITELMKSILKYGMLEPVILRRVGDSEFQLLSGNNRLQAVRELGLGTITSRVFEGISDTQAKNIYQDLHKKEEILIVEEKKSEPMAADKQADAKTVQDKQAEANELEVNLKQNNQAAEEQRENIHELKFKAVTTLSRDLPNYLL
jgi:hypothetical protein